ncbi:PLP-dependent aminotransferase family protein [Cardiobacteriaceae bacterium TAE3-ERU3]|nr:PLP-dependent aminotransferase family protein [Cardiobacteriaceae bacterium TAE3-ERU3]
MKHLILKLDKTQATPLYLQLYQQIKQEIYAGTLRVGQRLPSKRYMADYLAISRNTVESAYAQLLAEGYIEAKPRSGFFVCFDGEQVFAQSQPIPAPQPAANTKPAYRYDLNPNLIDTSLFPFSAWKKGLKNLLNQRHRDLLCLGDKQGEAVLREQIRQYLHTSRGVHCSAEQIIITAGVESGMSQLILLFAHHHPHAQLTYAMEEHGYPVVEHLLSASGKSVVKLPLLDAHQKIDFSLLGQSNADILYVTPSHQYPYATVLPIKERHQLLDWAHAKAGRYIIEDDYDSEFRYQGKPVPSLQHLDQHGHVIYLGSFSKLLMPSLRITFMVLPPALLPTYQRVCSVFNCNVSRIDQHLIADFMHSGEFEKHIYRMRAAYRKKMEQLCLLLQPYSEHLRYHGEASGFYLLIELRNESRSTHELEALAAQASIKLYPVKNHRGLPLFSLGFGHLTSEELHDAVLLLMQAWNYQKNTAP